MKPSLTFSELKILLKQIATQKCAVLIIEASKTNCRCNEHHVKKKKHQKKTKQNQGTAQSWEQLENPGLASNMGHKGFISTQCVMTIRKRSCFCPFLRHSTGKLPVASENTSPLTWGKISHSVL